MDREGLLLRASARSEVPVDLLRRSLEAVVAEVELSLADGEPVEIGGFGTWRMKRWGGRRHLDPASGEIRAARTRWHPGWVPAKSLKLRLRDAGAG